MKKNTKTLFAFLFIAVAVLMVFGMTTTVKADDPYEDATHNCDDVSVEDCTDIVEDMERLLELDSVNAINGSMYTEAYQTATRSQILHGMTISNGYRQNLYNFDDYLAVMLEYGNLNVTDMVKNEAIHVQVIDEETAVRFIDMNMIVDGSTVIQIHGASVFHKENGNWMITTDFSTVTA